MLIAVTAFFAMAAHAQTVEEDLAKIDRIHREMQELPNNPVPPLAPGLTNPDQQYRSAVRHYNDLQIQDNARRERGNQADIDSARSNLLPVQQTLPPSAAGAPGNNDQQRRDDALRAIEEQNTHNQLNVARPTIGPLPPPAASPGPGGTPAPSPLPPTPTLTPTLAPSLGSPRHP